MYQNNIPFYPNGYQNQQQYRPAGAANMAPQGSLYLKGRPVSSIEEARAAAIDFDGSVFYFPDIANQKIYTKQINMDGTSTLNMYEIKEIPISQPVGETFVTREELEQILLQLKNELQPTNNGKIQF